MQRLSYLAISSLALSVCGAICFLVFLMDLAILIDLVDYVMGLGIVCGTLAMILGLAALIQRGRYYRRLWWLALVGISICVVLVILSVIGIVLVLVFMDF